jgi:DNA-binding MarR family transcriptional regulator
MAESKKHAELAEMLTREMRKSSAGAVLISQAVADAVGLNPTDIECLDILLDAGPVPAGRLAELTGLTTGAITGLIDRLEKHGYVRRVQDPGDRRRVIVQPVHERLDEIKPLYAWLTQRMNEIYAGYTAEQLAVIAGFMATANEVGQEAVARLRAEAGAGAQGRAESPATTLAEGNSFVARLGSVSEGRLLFTRGMAGVEIAGSRNMDDLVRVRFERTTPDVQVQGGSVTVRQRHVFLGGPDSGSVTLNASIPWSIEVRSGLGGSRLDLRDVSLQDLRVKSGASGLELLLGRPSGVVPIRFAQGAERVTISLAEGVPARVLLKRGGNNLAFSGRRIASTGPTTWQSPGYDPTAGRYEIALHSGVNALTVETR